MTRFPKRQEVLRVGLVGLGYWGPNLLRVLSEMDGVRVSWICDLDAERLNRYGQRYPTARTTDDYELMLSDDDLDAVLIATPVFTHYDLASRALGPASTASSRSRWHRRRRRPTS